MNRMQDTLNVLKRKGVLRFAGKKAMKKAADAEEKGEPKTARAAEEKAEKATSKKAYRI